MAPRTFKIRINGALRGTPVVRVIGAQPDAMLGVMTLAKALRLAMKEGLDLVEVNPAADPPVCKLLDFRVYRYDEKRKKAAETTRRGEGDRDGAEPTWTPFECDGHAFEYCAMESKTQTRPDDWPPYKPSLDPWVAVVMMIVRRPGDQMGPARVYPEGTVITVEHALETARRFWNELTR